MGTRTCSTPGPPPIHDLAGHEVAETPELERLGSKLLRSRGRICTVLGFALIILAVPQQLWAIAHGRLTTAASLAVAIAGGVVMVFYGRKMRQVRRLPTIEDAFQWWADRHPPDPKP